MSETFDVIIVGLGAMGSAAAQHLARRGVRVLGLEQFAIPHALGSSHGHSRMIRMAYYEHPDYVPLLRRAYALWDELERRAGQKLLHITGGIYMGPASGGVVRGALESARMHELPHEVLDGPQLARRYPQFRLPENYIGVLEPRAGFLLPEKVIAAQAVEALHHGAQLRGHEPVEEWQADESSVSVTTPRGTYRAGHLLFCGGAWSGKLLSELRVPLVVTRQVMHWVWPADPGLFELGRFPVWGIDHPDGSLSYGFPMMREMPGLKIARHAPGAATDADQVERGRLSGDEAELRDVTGRFLPAADGPLLAHRVCLYTNTPDHHFIVDHHPRHRDITIAAGFSGHGFKFASVIGEALADLATKGTTPLPVGFLNIRRLLPAEAS